MICAPNLESPRMALSTRLLLSLAVSILMLSGCSNKGKTERTETISAAELYEDAKRSLGNRNYGLAIIYYRRLQARFPFSRHAEQAQLELAYAYFKDLDAEKAISSAERFIKTYPTHANVDYAYYLKGLINFDRDRGLVERLLPHTAADRDQNFAQQAFLDFSELLSKFPDSRYVPDARQRMYFLRNSLAHHEVIIARYYLERGANVAAAKRAKYVVENYSETPDVAEALAIMAESYHRLELPELAEDAEQVLKLNYPDHPYITGGGGKKRSFLRRLWPFGGEKEGA